MKHPHYWTPGFAIEVRLSKVPLPAFEAQKHTVACVEKVDQAIVLSEKKVGLLRELRETLLKNWKGRDPQTGKQLQVEEGADHHGNEE